MIDNENCIPKQPPACAIYSIRFRNEIKYKDMCGDNGSLDDRKKTSAVLVEVTPRVLSFRNLDG